jgi:cytidylate kinase
MIQKFLKEKRDFDDFPEYGFPFVTISRETGAGGHLLAHVINTDYLQKNKDIPLFEGWHVFDRELCELIARDPLLKKDVECLLAEKFKSQFNDFVESLYTGHSEQQDIYKSMAIVVRMLTLIGKVIIVGCAAANITSDLRQGIHVRLVATEANRIARVMKRFKMSKDDARAHITKQDKDRRKLIKTAFNREIDDPLLYDMIWNTSRVSLDVVSEATIALIKLRASTNHNGLS